MVTDEDRDINTSAGGNSISYADVLAALNSKNALLNSVVNANFADSTRALSLGIDSDGNAFVADGLGGYTTSGGANTTYAYGTTKADYIDLALASGGAAWSLNELRAGGNKAVSFTQAFTDIKVEEIIRQDPGVPEPTTVGLLAFGFFALIGTTYRRKRR